MKTIRARKISTLIVTIAVLGIGGQALSAWQEYLEVLPPPVVDSDFYEDGAPPVAKVELGRLLFFDKLLSGNRNISCATCHHPNLGTGDGLALPLGEGPRGLGPVRAPGDSTEDCVHGRVPRNSPPLFNLGAKEFNKLFHDGRVETDPRGLMAAGFISPAKRDLPPGLDNLLAVQAMFPVTSDREMAGQVGENRVADAGYVGNWAGPDGVWEIIADRLRNVPEYVEWFRAAYPGEIRGPEDITYVHAANAIAAFELAAFRSDDSPFDRFLRGALSALTERQKRGMEIFYGKGNCASCHSGKFQTDQDFHAIAMPQIGPGKGDGADPGYLVASGDSVYLEDFGRSRVTFDDRDRFKFRTPSLRNVALTGPWGHDGAYDTLEGVVRHHLDPVNGLEQYTLQTDQLPPLGQVMELTQDEWGIRQTPLSEERLVGFLMQDGWVQSQPELVARIAAANELEPVSLTAAEMADLLAFLESLTDPSAREMASLVPIRVPSRLPVED